MLALISGTVEWEQKKTFFTFGLVLSPSHRLALGELLEPALFPR